MFKLSIGLSLNYPFVRVSEGLAIRKKVEERFQAAGIEEFDSGSLNSIKATFRFDGRLTDANLVSARAFMVAGAAQLPAEAIWELQVQSLGAIPGFERPQSINLTRPGYGKCWISPKAWDHCDLTFLPRDFPKGVAHGLAEFQKLAEEFLVLTEILRRTETAKRLVEKNHNYRGATEKLETIPELIGVALRNLGHTDTVIS